MGGNPNAPKDRPAACRLVHAGARFPPLLAETGQVTLAAQTRGTAAERAAQVLAQMTLDEKLTLLKGYFGTDFSSTRFEAPDEAARRLGRLCSRHPAPRHSRAMAG
jgi:hypothetical protein